MIKLATPGHGPSPPYVTAQTNCFINPTLRSLKKFQKDFSKILCPNENPLFVMDEGEISIIRVTSTVCGNFGRFF